MDDKITIIEGPTPIFESLRGIPPSSMQNWALGLNQGPVLYDAARTTLRTFRGADLIERCHTTWQQNATMYLEYRDNIGLTRQTPIMAAQSVITEEGDVLVLWVRNDNEDEDLNEDDDEDNEDTYTFILHEDGSTSRILSDDDESDDELDDDDDDDDDDDNTIDIEDLDNYPL